MSRRWKQRPSGSTWGDWGDDDELGRINLLTPEKVLQGVREVEAGISFCLSLPLDHPGGTALNQRRHPPALAPTEDMQGSPATFFNIHMSEMEHWGDPKYVDVWSDDVVTLSTQYSTQWDSLAHVGAEFDADGDGLEEAVYYNGYRAGVDLVGPQPDAGGDGGQHRSFAHHLGLEHMAFHGMQGRGILVDLVHHLGREWRGVDLGTLQEIMAADGVVVEPGDMLLLHTGYATQLLEWNRNPDPQQLFRMCTWLDARDEALLEWIADRHIAALIADNDSVEGLLGKDRNPTRHSFLPIHHLCLFKLGVPLGELWYLHELAAWLREHDRSRFLLTAPPLRLPGAVGLARDADRDGVTSARPGSPTGSKLGGRRQLVERRAVADLDGLTYPSEAAEAHRADVRRQVHVGLFGGRRLLLQTAEEGAAVERLDEAGETIAGSPAQEVAQSDRWLRAGLDGHRRLRGAHVHCDDRPLMPPPHHIGRQVVQLAPVDVQVPVLIDHGRPQPRRARCRADPLRRRTVTVDRQLEPAQIRGRAEVTEQEVLEAELAEQLVEQAPGATS